MKLSVVIPSFKDPFLKKTIESILDSSELGDQLEIIVVLDGYWAEPIDHKRIRYVHLGKRRGMRDAINAGISVARGEFILRTDEHVMFAKGFDKKMVDSCQPNWIMTATRYALDPVKWERMDTPPFIHEKMKINNGRFEGQRWPSRDKELKDKPITETMAMQGSVWFMPKKWWDEVIVKLDTEHYGEMYQDSHEMIFKTWQAGGKMMVHKGTWFAHKHYSFPRTHNYGSQDDEPKIGYCLSVYGDYYNNVIKPLWKI